jgi:hypothetical protein
MLKSPLGTRPGSLCFIRAIYNKVWSTAIMPSEDQTLEQAARLWRIKAPLALLLMAAILFGGAGRIGWSAAWLFILLMAAAQVASFFLLRKVAPDLLIERSKMSPGAKSWDKWIAPLVAIVVPLATLIVAALETGGEWVRWPVQAAGFAVIVLGILLMLWAMSVNRFFSAMVRIQTERGHTVVSSGPTATSATPPMWAWWPTSWEHPWRSVAGAPCGRLRSAPVW